MLCRPKIFDRNKPCDLFSSFCHDIEIDRIQRIGKTALLIHNVLPQLARINFVAHPVDGVAILLICKADQELDWLGVRNESIHVISRDRNICCLSRSIF